jgi:hypothetical protein
MAPVDLKDDASGQFAADKEAVGSCNVGRLRNPTGRYAFSHSGNNAKASVLLGLCSRFTDAQELKSASPFEHLLRLLYYAASKEAAE